MGKYKLNDDTCFLFADSNLITGMATALDLGGTLIIYNNSRTPEEADARALASDWKITGKDIARGIKQFEQERP
jgi:hypothetical protein